MRRVRRQDFTWERGFDVTDVRQTKGLEFDEVILLETTASSYADSAQARHGLYVGATRAAHQLWCIASEAPSKLVLEGLDAEGYAELEPPDKLVAALQLEFDEPAEAAVRAVVEPVAADLGYEVHFDPDDDDVEDD